MMGGMGLGFLLRLKMLEAFVWTDWLDTGVDRDENEFWGKSTPEK